MVERSPQIFAGQEKASTKESLYGGLKLVTWDKHGGQTSHDAVRRLT